MNKQFYVSLKAVLFLILLVISSQINAQGNANKAITESLPTTNGGIKSGTNNSKIDAIVMMNYPFRLNSLDKMINK